jgi:hypothetical protein
MLKDDFVAARRASVPLLYINSRDPSACTEKLLKAGLTTKAVWQWDLDRGLSALNDAGQAALQPSLARAGIKPEATVNPTYALKVMAQAPELTVAFFFALVPEKLFEPPPIVNIVHNLRDELKAEAKMLVFVGPKTTLPIALQDDFIVLDDELPNKEALASMIAPLCQGARPPIPVPNEEEINRAAAEMLGLTEFMAEQTLAMSLQGRTLNFQILRQRKIQMIETAPGLKVYQGPERFADIGGVEEVKDYFTRLRYSKLSPRVVVFWDEGEKSLAGTKGDLSGVSHDYHGKLLSHMQDTNAQGIILYGVTGSSKSMIVKAFGNEADILTIMFDLGAMKDKLMGSSEQNLRRNLDIISAVGGDRVLWAMTCNSVMELSPELQRRFKRIFFFDIPSAEERDKIWQIYFQKYGLKPQPMPDDTDWTGAEIAQCSEQAWAFDIPLVEAARYIVPVSVSNAAKIEEMREMADGKFLSASYPGVYSKTKKIGRPEKTARPVRKLQEH